MAASDWTTQVSLYLENTVAHAMHGSDGWDIFGPASSSSCKITFVWHWQRGYVPMPWGSHLSILQQIARRCYTLRLIWEKHTASLPAKSQVGIDVEPETCWSAGSFYVQDTRRFLHAVYRVGDLDKTIEFYKQNFGFKQIRYRDIPEVRQHWGPSITPDFNLNVCTCSLEFPH